MPIGKLKIKKFVEPTPTSERSMLIYELLKTKSPQEIRLHDGYRTSEVMAVTKEVARLELEVQQKLSGAYIVDEAVVEVNAETGEETVVSDAVYYKPTTEYQMKISLDSDILDIATVVADTRKWSDGDPDNSPTWNVFKNSFVE